MVVSKPPPISAMAQEGGAAPVDGNLHSESVRVSGVSPQERGKITRPRSIWVAQPMVVSPAAAYGLHKLNSIARLRTE